MKYSTIIAVVVVIAVGVIWATLFRTSDKHPAMMSSLAGCYLSTGADHNRKVYVTASGTFRYGDKATSVIPYIDKQSLSLLPKLKVVLGLGGELEFLEGNPLLIRMDSNSRGFTVPSESGETLAFRKNGC